MTNPLAVIDIEGTSLDVTESRIVEFACVVVGPGGRAHWTQRFNPGIPIPPSATSVHGITDDDVKDCPLFSKFAAAILRGFKGKDIAGYNLRSYDLPVLDEEMRRCGLKLDLVGVNIIDAFGIFSNKEKRDLSSAVQKYCGRSHEGAHGALADAEATADVLAGQIAMYEDLKDMPMNELDKFSRRGGNEPADIAGKLYRKDGDLYYAFGKCKDVRVEDDPGFGWWIMRCDRPPFPGSTREVLAAYLTENGLW